MNATIAVKTKAAVVIYAAERGWHSHLK